MNGIATTAPAVQPDHPRTTIIRIDEYSEALRQTDDVRAFYSQDSNCSAIVSAIRDVSTEKKVKVISYDVFDTVLLRECKSEAARFLDISDRFVNLCRTNGAEPGFSVEDAFLARVSAARAAYAISPTIARNREGRFDDIARITCDLLNRSDLASAYVANELRYEVEATTANPIVQLIAKALPRTKIIFISDMYLEGDKISHLLSQKLGVKETGRVYSSADGFGSKRTGGIFAHVSAALAVTGEKILHIGDSLHSDYQMPRRYEWQSFHLPLPEAEKDARRRTHEATAAHFAKMGIDLDRYLQFNL